MKELYGLTGLRFLAAFYVFLFHISLRMNLEAVPAPVQTIISQGALGVNVFFVLSGFILTYAHLKDYPTADWPNRQYYKQFLLKRIARIYPAYLAGLLCSIGVSIWLDSFPKQFPLVLTLDAMMLQSYVPSLAMQWYGSGAWSVSTEFFFYLLFPFLLPLLLRLTATQTWILLAVGVVASSLPGLFYVLGYLSFSVTYPYPPSRLPEFMCGILCGVLTLRNKVRVSEWVALFLLAATGLYLAKFGSRLSGYTVHNLIVVPAIMALVNALAQPKNRLLAWIGIKPMQYLGRISFSFYIMQLPIMLVIDILKERQQFPSHSYALVGGVLLLNLILGTLLYELVEKRAHQVLLGKFVKQKTSATTSIR